MHLLDSLMFTQNLPKHHRIVASIQMQVVGCPDCFTAKLKLWAGRSLRGNSSRYVYRHRIRSRGTLPGEPMHCTPLDRLGRMCFAGLVAGTPAAGKARFFVMVVAEKSRPQLASVCAQGFTPAVAFTWGLCSDGLDQLYSAAAVARETYS